MLTLREAIKNDKNTQMTRGKRGWGQNEHMLKSEEIDGKKIRREEREGER